MTSMELQWGVELGEVGTKVERKKVARVYEKVIRVTIKSVQ